MSRTIGHIAILMGSRALTRGAQVFAFIVLARGLSPEGFGAYGVLTSAIFLGGQLGNVGLRQSSGYMIARTQLTTGEAIGTLCTLWPFLTIATATVVCFLTQTELANFGQSAKLAMFVAVAATLLISLLQGVFLGIGNMTRFAITDAAPRIILSMLAVFLAFVDSINLQTALWIFALSFAVVAPVAAWLAAQQSSPLKINFLMIPRMIRYGFLYAISMFLILLNTRVGLFFVKEQAGADAAGLFFAGQRINELFLEFATVVGLALFSQTARGSSDKQSVADAGKVCAAMLWGFSLLSIIIAVTAQFFVHTFLGSAYSGSTTVVKVLAIGLAPAALVKIMNGVIAGAGRPYFSAAVVLVGILSNIIFITFRPPLASELTASLGLVVGYWTMALLYVVAARFFYGVPYRTFLIPMPASRPQLRSAFRAFSTRITKKAR